MKFVRIGERNFYPLNCTRVRRGIKWLGFKPPHDWQRRMWSVNSLGQAECRIKIDDLYQNPLALAWESEARFADQTGFVNMSAIVSHFGLSEIDLLLLGFIPDRRDRSGVANLNRAWREMLLERATPHKIPMFHLSKARWLKEHGPHDIADFIDSSKLSVNIALKLSGAESLLG